VRPRVSQQVRRQVAHRREQDVPVLPKGRVRGDRGRDPYRFSAEGVWGAAAPDAPLPAEPRADHIFKRPVGHVRPPPARYAYEVGPSSREGRCGKRPAEAVCRRGCSRPLPLSLDPSRPPGEKQQSVEGAGPPRWHPQGPSQHEGSACRRA
jgi:hypothetical protein